VIRSVMQKSGVTVRHGSLKQSTLNLAVYVGDAESIFVSLSTLS
jgi:hypothetical protein